MKLFLRRPARIGRRLALLVLAWPTAALARPTVQPIFVRTPDLPADSRAQAAFEAQARRPDWQSPIALDVAAPPRPRAAAALATAIALLGELRVEEGLRELQTAADDATLTGGAGLTTAQLGDIYLFRAIAIQKAQPGATARAWEDYVRAATFNPERVLDPGRVPPAALETWNRAEAAVQRRAHGTLIVRAPAEATISIDARTPVRSPALLAGLSHGEHLVRVEEPGRWPWAASVPLATATLEIDVPFRPEVALDDGAAAEVAQQKGATFALVAQQKPAPGEAMLELRLVAVATRLRQARSLVAITGAGDLAAALDRMALQARGTEAPAPAVSAAPLPSRRLPIALAVAAAVVAGVVAAFALDATRGDSAPRGFSTTVRLPTR